MRSDPGIDRASMTVAELIEYLRGQPQDLTVIYQCYSEAAVLEPCEIKIQEYAVPRSDGWVHRRPDGPQQTYLVLPGN